jgi:DNA processing protein
MGTAEFTTIYKEDESYPELLRQIADPPAQLYCRGDISLLNSFCIGVVGTRKASDYGRQACSDIVGHLAASGITIVSGLAAGIDTVAHRSTLTASGKTIAVFGTGISDADIFPRDNVQLAHEIIASGGLLISEYEPGIRGQVWTFPLRNRIISGLSRGVLVIEADQKSGSLITAKSALDQDRDVFAVPGSIYWPRSIGTNLLIQQGARPVMNGMDILQSYQLRQVPLPSDESGVSTHDPVQEKILAILKSNGPTHLDSIAAESGFETHRVMGAVALLELHGHIRHQGAGIYS